MSIPCRLALVFTVKSIMKKRIIIAIAVTSIAGFALWAWSHGGLTPSPVSAAANPQVGPAEGSITKNGMFGQRWGENAPPPDTEARIAAGVAALRTSGPPAVRAGQLQNWRRDAITQCTQLQIDDCQHWLLAGIDNWPDQAAAATARTALTKLAAVHAAETALVQSTTTPLTERLAKLSALRQSIMGNAAADAWFGREEATIGFRAAVNEFAQGPARALALQARMAEVEKLRSRYYGNYYADLKAEEGAQLQYQIEYGLARLDVADASKDEALRQQLRGRYFDAATVQAQAAREAQLADQQLRQGSYAVALAELNARYRDDVASPAYQAELDNLRQKTFENR